MAQMQTLEGGGLTSGKYMHVYADRVSGMSWTVTFNRVERTDQVDARSSRRMLLLQE